MDTKRILDLPIPVLDDVVRSVVARYEPALLTPRQTASALPAIKHLILACEPVSVGDAKSMLATASHFFADVGGDGESDLDKVLTDLQVSRWLHMKLRDGMPSGTVENHRLRLARFLRVRRGLPARIRVVTGAKRVGVPLDDEALSVLHGSLSPDDPQGLAACVAAIRAGRIGQEAVGASVALVDGRFTLVSGDRCWAIVTDLWSWAAEVVGVEVDDRGWARLRDCAESVGIEFDRCVARDTFAVFALGEDESLATLVRRYELPRRMIDTAAPQLPDVDPLIVKSMLRG